ncbi:10506_t:CDS:2 [Racocetra persica]|uniref:10506_t:CDS:1 n=1 Tax=Racocetra persica TaxID=160502 RepID=A0ACA9NMC0_9GLOM|nr:10506_t:CDS:2 [Racocetra persica]
MEKVGLQPEDAKFVDYLEENDYSAEDVSNNVNIEILKENYQKSLSSQVNQNNFGFTFENSNTLSAEALVDLELHSATWQPTFEKIKDFDIANFPNFTPKQKDLLLELSREFNENLWKDLGFTSKQYQEWLDVGVQDHAFAS